MFNFRTLRKDLFRGGLAGLKAEVLLWIIVLSLSAVTYLITIVV
jgi:hypothetical protein